jgi:hypothetical protein
MSNEKQDTDLKNQVYKDKDIPNKNGNVQSTQNVIQGNEGTNNSKQQESCVKLGNSTNEDLSFANKCVVEETKSNDKVLHDTSHLQKHQGGRHNHESEQCANSVSDHPPSKHINSSNNVTSRVESDYICHECGKKQSNTDILLPCMDSECPEVF